MQVSTFSCSVALRSIFILFLFWVTRGEVKIAMLMAENNIPLADLPTDARYTTCFKKSL